jgi:alpha-galactosidase
MPNKIMSRDAYAIFNEEMRSLSFGNRYFENRLFFDESNSLKHSGILLKSGDRLIAASGSGAVFSLKINFHRLTGKDFIYKKCSLTLGDKEDVQIVLEMTCLKFQMDLSVRFRILPDCPGFQQWVEATARESGLLLHAASPMDYEFELQGLQVIGSCIRGCKHQGVTEKDTASLPYEDFATELHELGSLYLKSGRRSTEELLSYVAVRETAMDAGMFAGVQWSGHWFLDAHNDISAQEKSKLLTIAGGPDEFYRELNNGESFVSPKCYLGVFESDFTNAAEAHKTFLKMAVIPHKPWKSLPVAYNSWYGTEEKIEEPMLRSELDLAKKAGLEYFIIDAGWYGGTDTGFSCIGDFSIGQGYWEEDRKKFPTGIGDFSEKVHEKGMKFGLWIEPERVDIRTDAVGGWKKEWLSCDENGEPHLMRSPLCDSGWLCLSHPEAREWVVGRISHMVESYHLDWLKIDSNWWAICGGKHHGHQRGDGEYTHIEGLYEIYQRVMKKYPDLIIENCSGGGTRMDAGIMQFSHIQWVDDESELPQRVRAHCSRLAAYMPQSDVYTFLCPKTTDVREYLKFPDDGSVDLACTSRMMGPWGVSYRLGLFSERVFTRIAKNIEIYKNIRDTVAQGSLENVMPIGALQRPEMKVRDPEVYRFEEPDGKRFVWFVFYNEMAGRSLRISCDGVNADAKYKLIRAHDASERTISGAELAESSFEAFAVAGRLSDIFILEILP